MGARKKFGCLPTMLLGSWVLPVMAGLFQAFAWAPTQPGGFGANALGAFFVVASLVFVTELALIIVPVVVILWIVLAVSPDVINVRIW